MSFLHNYCKKVYYLRKAKNSIKATSAEGFIKISPLICFPKETTAAGRDEDRFFFSLKYESSLLFQVEKDCINIC